VHTRQTHFHPKIYGLKITVFMYSILLPSTFAKISTGGY